MLEKIKILGQFQAWCGQLSRRGQLLLMIGAMLVILLFWYLILIRPLFNQKNLEAQQGKLSESSIITLKGQVLILENQIKQKIDQEKKLEMKIEKINEQISQITPSSKVVIVFKELLKEEPGVELLSFDNLPDEGFMNDKKGKPLLYKQRVELNFESEYLPFVAYLEKIEKQPWEVFWEEIDYQVMKYPLANIRVIIYTLSNVRED